MAKGRLIVLEGADGSGKSTHSALLADHLRARGHDVVTTAEPTKGPIGRLIREVLSSKIPVSEEALALLFCADRAEHIKHIIEPALSDGKTVISDRYYYSSVAYQSVQGLSESWVSQINAFVPDPDIVVVLEIDTEEALRRMGSREKEVFEFPEFQKRVQEKLLELAYRSHDRLSRPGKKWKVIGNTDEPEIVQAKIRDFIDSAL